MKLTDRERKVIAAVRLHANAPIPAISKLLKMQQGSVRYSLKSLEERKVISKNVIINLRALGLAEYEMACAFGPRSSKEREEFHRTIASSERIPYFTEMGGGWQYAFTVCAMAPEEANSYLLGIREAFGNSIFDETLHIALGWALYSPKYLGHHGMQPSKMERMPVGALPKVDQLDLKILTSLMTDPHGSLRNHAEKLHIPHTTLGLRMKRLRREKILLGTIYSIHPQTFGHQEFRLYLSLRGLTSALHGRLNDFAEHHRNVSFRVTHFGRWQFCLGITVAHADEATLFVNELYDKLGQSIVELRLLPVLRRHQTRFNLEKLLLDDSHSHPSTSEARFNS